MFEEPTLLGKRFFTQMLILDWAEITLKISGLDLENPRSTSFWATDLPVNTKIVKLWKLCTFRKLENAWIYAPLGPGTARCEFVRYFSGFIGPSAVWSEFFKNFAVLRFWNFSGAVRSFFPVIGLTSSGAWIPGPGYDVGLKSYSLIRTRHKTYWLPPFFSENMSAKNIAYVFDIFGSQFYVTNLKV